MYSRVYVFVFFGFSVCFCQLEVIPLDYPTTKAELKLPEPQTTTTETLEPSFTIKTATELSEPKVTNSPIIKLKLSLTSESHTTKNGKPPTTNTEFNPPTSFLSDDKTDPSNVFKSINLSNQSESPTTRSSSDTPTFASSDSSTITESSPNLASSETTTESLLNFVSPVPILATSTESSNFVQTGPQMATHTTSSPDLVSSTLPETTKESFPDLTPPDTLSVAKISFLPDSVLPISSSVTTTESSPNLVTTASPPTTPNSLPVLCSVCVCKSNVVDCSNSAFKESFSQKEWEELKDAGITEINLSGNFIGFLPQITIELPIEILNISNSGIEKVDDQCFKNLPNLATLDLSMNDIVSLHKSAFLGLFLPDQRKIRPFVKMRYLSLAYNELHTLPKDAFMSMQDLTFLDLSGNPLGVIDQVVMGALSDLLSLKELRLSSCELDSLPTGLLRRQRRLQRLDISDNLFTTVPDVLGEAANLVYLNLNRNLITSLSVPTSITKLTKLEELHICRNTRLQIIGPGALGLKTLVRLWICNNPRLSEINDDFLTWTDEHLVGKRPSLKELYLHNNNLTKITPNYLNRWDQLQKMDFSDNPYSCCDNQWMVDVLVSFIITNGGSAADMICNTPQEVRGLSFTQLHLNSRVLKCNAVTEAVKSAGPNMAIILGVIGVFVTFPIVLMIVLLWRKGYFAKCRRKLNSDKSDSEDEDDAF